MPETAARSNGLEGFIKYARPRPTRHFVYGVCLGVLHWVILYSLAYGVLRAYLRGGALEIFSAWLFIGCALAELVGRVGRRLRVNTPRALARARGVPVLYLRSFYYESPEGRRTEVSTKRHGRLRPERENDDEVLALALGGAGTLVAAGNPGTRLSSLGAIRLFFPDGEWKSEVTRLIGVARLVIIQPGYSDGTEWEMRVLHETLPPEKIIFSFLAWQRLGREARQREYEIFGMQFRRVFCREPPPRLGNNYFLHFEGDWQPRLTGVPLWQRPFFWLHTLAGTLTAPMNASDDDASNDPISMAVRLLPRSRFFRRYCVPGVREALRPVLRQRGFRLPVWRTLGFFAAIVLAVAAASWVRSVYNEVPGHYHVSAYKLDRTVVLFGDLRVRAAPFEGTYELTFAPDFEVPPDCRLTPSWNGGSLLGVLRGESSPDGLLTLTFEGLGRAGVYEREGGDVSGWFYLGEEPLRDDEGSAAAEKSKTSVEETEAGTRLVKERATPDRMKKFLAEYGTAAVEKRMKKMKIDAQCGGKRIMIEKLLW